MPKLFASCISRRSFTLDSTNGIPNGNAAVVNSISTLFFHPMCNRLHLYDKGPSSIPSRYLRRMTQSAHTHAISFQPILTISASVFTLSKAVPPKLMLSPRPSQLYTPSSALQSQTPSSRTPLHHLTLSLRMSPTPRLSVVSSPPSLLVHLRNRKRTT